MIASFQKQKATKETIMNALKGRFCENCWVYNELFFKTEQNAKRVIKRFNCKLEITSGTSRNPQIKIPESLGCENFVPEEQQLPIKLPR